jgi:hypothetical protein
MEIATTDRARERDTGKRKHKQVEVFSFAFVFDFLDVASTSIIFDDFINMMIFDVLIFPSGD